MIPIYGISNDAKSDLIALFPFIEETAEIPESDEQAKYDELFGEEALHHYTTAAVGCEKKNAPHIPSTRHTDSGVLNF